MKFREFATKYRRWKSIRETVAALEALPTRELDDIGIARWEIRDLARRHAG